MWQLTLGTLEKRPNFLYHVPRGAYEVPNWVTTIAYMGAYRKRIHVGGCRAILVCTGKKEGLGTLDPGSGGTHELRDTIPIGDEIKENDMRSLAYNYIA